MTASGLARRITEPAVDHHHVGEKAVESVETHTHPGAEVEPSSLGIVPDQDVASGKHAGNYVLSPVISLLLELQKRDQGRCSSLGFLVQGKLLSSSGSSGKCQMQWISSQI